MIHFLFAEFNQEFNQQKKQFEFREIEFNENGNSKQPYQISKIGGADGKCLTCHSNSRPIWEAYPVWPGFYGADDDTPIKYRYYRFKLGLAAPSTLKEEWKNFKEKSLNKGRYQFLRPLADSLIFEGLGVRPNADLTALLTNLNYLRIGEILKKEVSSDFRFPFLYGVSCTEDLFRAAYLARMKGEPAPLMPEDKFTELVDLYSKTSNQKIKTHQVYRMNRLMNELQYNFSDLRALWAHQLSSVDPDLKDIPKDQFIARIVEDDPSSFGTMASPVQASVAALAEKFFPKTYPETWPSAVYEGVFRFDTGAGDEKTNFKKMIEENLFTPAELPELRQLESKDKNAYCDLLKSKFPPALK